MIAKPIDAPSLLREIGDIMDRAHATILVAEDDDDLRHVLRAS
jgi:hypothetical protein